MERPLIFTNRVNIKIYNNLSIEVPKKLVCIQPFIKNFNKCQHKKNKLVFTVYPISSL